MKYFIVTFGCQMNVHDSEKIAAAHKDIVESILSAINSHLFLGGNKLVKAGNSFFIVSVMSPPCEGGQAVSK